MNLVSQAQIERNFPLFFLGRKRRYGNSVSLYLVSETIITRLGDPGACVTRDLQGITQKVSSRASGLDRIRGRECSIYYLYHVLSLLETLDASFCVYA